jgi:peptidoglycan/LPS O-acetylase OafA/YrhL
MSPASPRAERERTPSSLRRSLRIRLGREPDGHRPHRHEQRSADGATGPEHGQIVQAGEVRSARIESLRAFAAFGVYTAHTWGLATQYSVLVLANPFARLPFNGTLGVMMFFSLAGYLLFWPFVKQLFGTGERINLKQYALNRILRIVPLYLFAVTVLMILSGNASNTSWWLHYATLSANFDIPSLGIDGPLWSVAVEMHYYLLLPLFAVLLGWICRRSIWKAAAVILILGMASLFFALAFVTPHVATPAGKSLLSKFYYFVPGMMVALLRAKWQRDGVPWWLRGPIASPDVWYVLAFAIILEQGFRANFFPTIDETNLNYFPENTVAFFLMVGACVLPLKRGFVTRVLELRFLAAFGTITYSFYVWHRPIVEAIAGRHTWFAPELYAITFPLILLVAFLSYNLVERPFLRLRRRWASSAAGHVRRRGAQPAPATAPAG